MRKNRQLILNEGNLFLEKNNIQVYKESNNTYYFESQANNLNYFFTSDYLESVSALMKIKNTKKFKKLWNIEITEEMRNVVNYGSSLYWLTGGDKEWSMYKTYNVRWDEAIDLFVDQYEDVLIIINQNCKTLGDVRDQLIKHINLPTIYEFCLEKGIIKK